MNMTNSIQSIRQDKGIRQADLARRLGVHPTNYPKIEKRGNKLSLEMVEKIAAALGVTVVELITYPELSTTRKIIEHRADTQTPVEELYELNEKINSHIQSVHERLREIETRRERARMYYERYFRDRQMVETNADSIAVFLDEILRTVDVLIG